MAVVAVVAVVKAVAPMAPDGVEAAADAAAVVRAAQASAAKAGSEMVMGVVGGNQCMRRTTGLHTRHGGCGHHHQGIGGKEGCKRRVTDAGRDMAREKACS